MKKLLSLLFAATMVFALSMPALANGAGSTKTHKTKTTKVHKTHKTSAKSH